MKTYVVIAGIIVAVIAASFLFDALLSGAIF